MIEPWSYRSHRINYNYVLRWHDRDFSSPDTQPFTLLTVSCELLPSQCERKYPDFIERNIKMTLLYNFLVYELYSKYKNMHDLKLKKIFGLHGLYTNISALYYSAIDEAINILFN